MFNEELNVEVCDATKLISVVVAGYIIQLLPEPLNIIKKVSAT